MSRSNHGSRKAMEENVEMKVIKRNGKMENISFDKILRRLKKIGKGNNIKINYTSLAMRIIDQLYTKIPTAKIDELTAEQCASMSSISPDYEVLALHIVVSNHHKNTQASFVSTMNELYNFRDTNGAHTPLVADSFIEVVRENADFFDELCDFKRDFLLSYFGFKTLEKSYLMHINKRIVERPQHMWLRVAIGIHGRDLENVRRTYDLMSQKKFTHATPTLFNSGTPRPQLSSCFLLAMDDDSIEGIFNTISECSLISKWSGGIGVACSKIRANGSIIRGTNGRSNGIVPMLRVFNSTCLYVDQCFTPETVIYTTEGPQQIQNVRAGETAIYNITGGTEVIRDVLEHTYDGAMCVVKSPVFMEDMRVTPQHPIAVIRMPANFTPAEETVEELTQQMMFEEPAKIHRAAQWRDYLNDPSIEVEWIEAADLSPVTDRIVYAVPEEPTTAVWSKEAANLTAPSLETCFMYGLMLANGDMRNDDTHATVSFYKKYDNIREFLDVYFDRHCVHVEVTEEEYPVKDWNKVIFKWKKTVDMPFRYTDFYGASHEKRIHSDWLNLPNTHIKEILRGIIFSYSVLKIGNELFFDNASRELIEGMRYMFLRIGVLCGGYKLQSPDFENAEYESSRSPRLNPTYVMKIPRTDVVLNILYGESEVAPAIPEPAAELSDTAAVASEGKAAAAADNTYMTYKNFLLAPVADIQTTIYTGTLYDLKMPTEHNYTIHHGVVHNGGGKRNGSFAIYLEPWHADVEDFLQMRKNHGDENLKARDLFYALWIPDLFMKRVKEEGTWTLMCPNECPGLCDVYGEEFEALYTKYEQEHRGRRTVDARKLWLQILDAQMETGTPYLVYKDSVNRKSNQKNVGTIKSSNLCVAPETMVLTDRGNVEIRELWQNQEKVRVWNGAEFSEVEIVKTGEDQKLIDVYIEDIESTINGAINECVISCTLYHKFFVYDEQGVVVVKEAQQLRVGDKLQNFKLPYENFTHDNIVVSRIIDEGRRDDTYCFTEPLRHAGIFNGILTSQCSEIVEYTDKNETAVCNLASIALPAYVKKEGAAPATYDFAELHEVAKVVTYNLNRVIDVNYYPNEKTRRSNMRHRPIGLGVQGLADVFMMMGLPFESEDARALNRQIFETIYHAALESSCEIAQKEGAYETFAGSPSSEGMLQFDLWGVDPGTERYDWPALKARIREHGLRNSLLVAPMPTASTSQILGYNECFEPITSNIYSRRTLAGDFVVVNRYMMEDLIELGLWTKELKDNIIENNGSIQHLDVVPIEIRKKYMTVWEMSPKSLIDMAADRGAFICQSMSLNLWVEDPKYAILTKIHFYAYEKGLKTGIYYLRRRARHQAQQFTIKPEKAQIKEDEICEMCSA